MVIAYMGQRYPIARNIIDKIDSYNYIDILTHNFEGIFQEYCHFFRDDIPSQCVLINNLNHKLKCDILVHLFNLINLGNTPYVTTFETNAPRYFIDNEFNLNILFSNIAKSTCRGIVALSENAYNIEKKFIKNKCNTNYQDDVYKKLVVLHPPQKIFAEKPNKILGNINFVFIGGDFFRKGGYEIVKVFEKIFKKFKNFHLHIVSRLNLDKNWNVSKTSLDEYKEIKDKISTSEYITWHKELKNEDTIELLKKCHVGLLPSYQDTYGYSVLEMQASGIPVITTNIRALPEINNEKSGWLIDFPYGWELGSNSDIDTVNSYKKTIINELYNIIISIIQNPSVISNKGHEAINRVKIMHDPEQYAKKLLKIYGTKL